MASKPTCTPIDHPTNTKSAMPLIEDLDEVLDMMRDGVRLGVRGRARRVEAAVVPADRAVIAERLVEVLEGDVRTAEAVREDHAGRRRRPYHLVSDAGAVARHHVTLLDPRNHSLKWYPKMQTAGSSPAVAQQFASG